MGDLPTAAKRPKTNHEQIFIAFLEIEPLCKDIEFYVKCVVDGIGTRPLTSCPVKIENADASMCKSFSNAHGTVQFHKDKADEHVHFFIGTGQQFLKGCIMLLAFVNEKLVPEGKQERKLLERLLTDLSRPNPKPLFEGGKETERNWCLKLAQHLLSQLCLSKKYTIGNRYDGEPTKVFPCKDNEELFGVFDDTSFGKKHFPEQYN